MTGVSERDLSPHVGQSFAEPPERPDITNGEPSVTAPTPHFRCIDNGDTVTVYTSTGYRLADTLDWITTIENSDTRLIAKTSYGTLIELSSQPRNAPGRVLGLTHTSRFLDCTENGLLLNQDTTPTFLLSAADYSRYRDRIDNAQSDARVPDDEWGPSTTTCTTTTYDERLDGRNQPDCPSCSNRSATIRIHDWEGIVALGTPVYTLDHATTDACPRCVTLDDTADPAEPDCAPHTGSFQSVVISDNERWYAVFTATETPDSSAQYQVIAELSDTTMNTLERRKIIDSDADTLREAVQECKSLCETEWNAVLHDDLTWGVSMSEEEWGVARFFVGETANEEPNLGSFRARERLKHQMPRSSAQ